MDDFDSDREEIEHYDRFSKLSAHDSARGALIYLNRSMTAKQRELLSCSPLGELSLKAGDWYEMVQLKRYIMGLEMVIRETENRPPPKEPIGKRQYKRWTLV